MMIDGTTAMALQDVTQGGFDHAAQRMGAIKQPDQLDIAAREFEAMFVAEMMKPMFAGIEVDETFGGGKGEEIFRGLMLQEYGKLVAETGQIGIADAVKAQLIEIQGGSRNNPETIDIPQEGASDDPASL